MVSLDEDDRGPGERLLERIDERFSHPFSYEELRMRQYELDDGQLAPTFAGLVSSGELRETTVAEEGYETVLTGEEQELLTTFHAYLDEEDAWIREGPAFPNVFSDDEALERFSTDVDGFDAGTYRTLSEKGAISRQGAYAFFTDEGWLAIHAETGEPVYVRE